MNYRTLHRGILNSIDAFFDEDEEDADPSLYEESAADLLNTIRAKLSAPHDQPDNVMRTVFGVFRECLVCEVGSPTEQWREDVCPDCRTQNKCLGCGHLRIEGVCLCAVLPPKKEKADV